MKTSARIVLRAKICTVCLALLLAPGLLATAVGVGSILQAQGGQRAAGWLISGAALMLSTAAVWAWAFGDVYAITLDAALRRVTIRWLFPWRCIVCQVEEIAGVRFEEEWNSECGKTLTRVVLALRSGRSHALTEFSVREEEIDGSYRSLEAFLTRCAEGRGVGEEGGRWWS